MKNTVTNKTESFKRMRQQEIDFINKTPFYGAKTAEKLYNKVKSNYNILQVGVCGVIVNIVSYKKDADNIRTILASMFPERRIMQKTSELTELVTTYTLPK